MLYLAKLSFRSEGKIKSSPEANLKEFISTKTALQESARQVLQAEKKGY